MRPNLGHIFLLSAALLGGAPATIALGATTGLGVPQAGKPLGTLWYPGPYTPKALPSVSGPASTPPLAPPISAPSANPAPVAIPAQPPVGQAQPGKPLGTLWYPGSYDPKTLKPVLQPTPVAKPTPAPLLPPRPSTKPLGTLWYPGPYDSRTNIPDNLSI